MNESAPTLLSSSGKDSSLHLIIKSLFHPYIVCSGKSILDKLVVSSFWHFNLIENSVV